MLGLKRSGLVALFLTLYISKFYILIKWKNYELKPINKYPKSVTISVAN